MGRKSESFSSPQKIDPTDTNNNDLDNPYRKRLRSWKQPITDEKHGSSDNDKILPSHRSTIYRYPIPLNQDHQSMPSSAILSESFTMKSAFYRPSTSSTSVQTINDVNNNHIPTRNPDNRKRKTSSLSNESSSQTSRITTMETVSDLIEQKNIRGNLHLTHDENSTKRSRFCTHDSIITNHHLSHSPIILDSETIDINQLDPRKSLSSTMHNESFINNPTSMEAAVKMVQPIVEIIFNAFEDQLKHIQTKSITSPFCSPLIMPSLPLSSPARPIVLHAVNFNIQLSKKQSHCKLQYLAHENLSEKDKPFVTSFTDLQENFLSHLLSNSLISEHRDTGNLRRIVQLAVVGFSVLCGYWLL